MINGRYNERQTIGFCRKVSRMSEKESNQIQMFKNLLKKMYEKGETQNDVSTKDIIQDMEVELRSIFAK